MTPLLKLRRSDDVDNLIVGMRNYFALVEFTTSWKVVVPALVLATDKYLRGRLEAFEGFCC